MGNEQNLDAMWDEAFSEIVEEEDDGAVETTPGAKEENDNSRNDGGETNNGEGDTDEGESGSEGQNDGGGTDTSASAPILSEQDLAEINAELGTNYRDPSEFPQSRRYIELRENGRFTAREALAAVGALAKKGTAVGSSKGHLTSTRGRGSNGEVMTSADKRELEKWGFKTQGKDLEKLWNRAGG